MRPVFLPAGMDELWDLVSKHPESALYGGGTDLFVRMHKGMVSPPSLICLERVAEIRGVRDHGDKVFLGASSTFAELMADSLILAHFPILARALGLLGSPQIRNMGTIGGNLVTASPAGDSLPPLYVLGAECEIRSRTSRRIVPIREFIKGPGRTDLSPGEILYGIWLRKGHPCLINFFEKVGQRNSLAISIVSMAALLDLSDAGVIEKAVVAWGSVGPTVVVSSSVNACLVGRPLDDRVLSEAASLARDAVSPIDDVRATAWYRREIAGNLLLRLLDQRP